MNTEKFDVLWDYIYHNGVKRGARKIISIEHEGVIFELSITNLRLFSFDLYIPELDKEETVHRFYDSKFNTIEAMLEHYYIIVKEDKEKADNKKNKRKYVLDSFLGNTKIKQ